MKRRGDLRGGGHLPPAATRGDDGESPASFDRRHGLPSIWDDWRRPHQPGEVRAVLSQCDRALEGRLEDDDPTVLPARVLLAMPADLEGVRAHAWAAYVVATNPGTATVEAWEVAVELAYLYRCEVRAFRNVTAPARRRAGK